MSAHDEQEKLRKLLNASGFAFQLAVELAVRSATFDDPWRVAAREHPWSTTNGRGYVDLVLSRGNIHLVIECKRPRDAVWMFLMPDHEQLKRSHACIRWTDTMPHRRSLVGWGDIQVYPASPETDFCAVRGQGETDSPMLERVASSLVDATDGVSADFLLLHHGSRVSSVLVPVIVTTAALTLASFDPKNVDLHTGDLDAAQFTTVSHLRFRKSLASTTHPDFYEPQELEDLSSGSERTVFVVNAAYFVDWLREFQTSAPDYGSPWESARGQAEAEG